MTLGHKIEKKNKKKSEGKKSERREKERSDILFFSLLTEEIVELSYEHRLGFIRNGKNNQIKEIAEIHVMLDGLCFPQLVIIL